MILSKALRAAAGNTSPVAPTDPQFNYVSMLLHGDGTNGAQNNTFVPTPITAPASGYYAGYFDGNGDYLTVPDNAAFNFGSGDLTVEMWLYPTAPGQSGYTFIYTKPNGTGYSGVAIIQDPSSYAIKLYCSSTGSSWDLVNGATIGTLPANTWSHVAVSRSGANVLTFLNGVLGSTTAISTSSLLSTTSAVHVGSSLGNANTFFTGYVSNLRVVKGTAVYTAAFTPPTAPLTAISGTSLLTCMSGFGATFSDLSSNNFTITRFGNATMTGVATTPPGAAPFSASLPGSPSYVTVGGGMPSGAGTAFTMECWIYITSLSDYNAITRGDISPRLDWGVDTSGSLKLDSVTVANICSSATGVITANTWYHVAVTRSTGNVYKLWANGTNVATSSAFGTSMTANTTIGYSSFSSSHFFKGRISNFRVATSEVYTANFAPPSAPLTAISGTSLLTFQNATFLDNSPNAYSVTANGSAAITSSNVLPAITRNGNTTQGSLSPYGNLWSNYFDGTGDYLNTPSNAAFSFGTGDFTVELWAYCTQDLTNGSTQFSLYASESINSSGSFGLFFLGGTWYVRINGLGNDLTAAASASQRNTWVHFAVCRNAGTMTFYINGASVASGNRSTQSVTQTQAYLGFLNGFTGYDFAGYMSNVRAVKGTAVYTSAFTPPTAPLTAISGTSLLTCQSNRFRDASANNFTITRNGDVQVTKEAPFLPTAAYSTSTIGGSGYFDGTGDYLSFANSAAFAFGTGNFTVEYWIYSNSFSSAPTVVDNRSGVTSTNGYADYFNTTGTFALYIGNTTIYTSASAIPTKTWAHIAVSRSGTSLRVFINGVQSGATVTNSTNLSDQFLLIGTNSGATNSFNGYVANLRLVKGTAVYTTNFTPPTAPVTAISGTSLLLNFTNAGIFDNAAENDLETVGNAQISTSVKKYGTGSLAFDGTGDWLLAPNNPNIQLGDGTFTIECWVYPTTSGSAMAIAGKAATTTTGWEIGINSSNLFFFFDGTSITYSGSVPLNTWTHVAVVRTPVSNGTKLYLNGVSSSSTTSTTNFNDSGLLYVGAGRTGRLPFTGYIDDFRITKGVARYTANFTPPTAAFPDQ